MSQSNEDTEAGLKQEVLTLKRQVVELTGRTEDQELRIVALEAKTGVVRTTTAARASNASSVSSTNASDAKLPAGVDASLAASGTASNPTVPASGTADNKTPVKDSQPAASPVKLPALEPVNKESLGDWLTRKAPVILSRLGVAAVVIGLCFAVVASWQHFGPWIKIGAGFAAAAGLVIGGEVFSRRKNWGWYGQAITGGGYALAYFVMYAAENIASVKVLDSPLLGMWGLLAVAGGAMAHAVGRRSEAMALLSTLLAFGTISLSPVSAFTVAATAILMVGLSAAVVRQRWLTVYGLATAGSYLTYVLFTQPQIALAGGAAYGFWLSAGFLAIFWVVWSVVGFRLFALMKQGSGTEGGDIFSLLPEAAKAFKPRLLFGVSLLNGIAFIGSSMLAIADVYPEYFYLLLFVLSGAYFVTALAARLVAWKENAVVSSFVGLALASSALALKLDPTATLVIWFLEVPLLVYFGLRNNFASFRAFALLLSAVSLGRFVLGGALVDGHSVFEFLFTVPYNVMVGGFAVVALGVTALLYRRTQRVSDWGLSESRFASTAYAVAALALVWGLTIVQAPFYATAAILSVEALVLALGAQRFGLVTVSGASKFFLASALVGAVATYADIGVTQIAIVLGINFGMAALYRTGRFSTFHSIANGLTYYVGITLAGVIAALVLTHLKVDTQILPLVAGVETLALLVAGIALRDPVLRLASNLAAALIAIGLFSTLGAWTWPILAPTVALLYAVYAAYRFIPSKRHAELDSILTARGLPAEALNVNLAGLFSFAATLVLTASFMSILSWQHLAVALALEGFALVAASFLVRDRQFFLSGLAVFALLIGKLAFYDLRDAEPIWRIISFVVAGLVMLAAAFIGVRFNKVFAPAKDTAGDTANAEARNQSTGSDGK